MFATDGAASDSSPTPSSSTSSGGEDDGTGEDDEKLDLGSAPDMGDDVPPSVASCDDLEDLPTTWGGYDKLPVRAKLFANTGVPMVAMSGKFHTSWGEFGGYKHADALRYEAASMVAYGVACNFGDQLHPLGEMELDTYRNIGEAFAYVEQIEEYGIHAQPVSTLGLWRTGSEADDEGTERHDRRHQQPEPQPHRQEQDAGHDADAEEQRAAELGQPSFDVIRLEQDDVELERRTRRRAPATPGDRLHAARARRHDVPRRRRPSGRRPPRPRLPRGDVRGRGHPRLRLAEPRPRGPRRRRPWLRRRPPFPSIGSDSWRFFVPACDCAYWAKSDSNTGIC